MRHILVLAAVLFFAGPAEATLINGDFETGDLTGWTTIGSNGQAIDYSLAPGAFATTLPLVPTYSGGTFGGFNRTGGGIERGFSQLVSVTPGVALNFSLDFALREVQGAFGAGTVITLLLDGGIVDQLTLDVTSAPFFGSFGGTFTPTSNQVLWEMVVNRPTNFGTGHGQVFFDNAILVPQPVTIDWVTVGGAGNADDTTGFGAVAEVYRISQFEVTNAQYTEFLNAVADADPNGLYDTGMGSGFGGITQSESSPNFTYSAIAGREDMPVNFISFYDSLRFANWLDNGQPVGAQDNTTTEDGAYTITPAGIAANSIVRNSGATVFLTSEDEWYKAAYYDPGTDSYFDYPAGSDTQTTCTTPGATANTANCENTVGDFSDVGSYTGAASPNGTFDQGGNVLEWNEGIVFGALRALRGGNFGFTANDLAASVQANFDPTVGNQLVGFRVASPTPPSSGDSIPTLSPAGLLVFAVSLLGFIGYYRRRF